MLLFDSTYLLVIKHLALFVREFHKLLYRQWPYKRKLKIKCYSLVDGKMTYNKLHIFEEHSLRSFDVGIWQQNHHHNQHKEYTCCPKRLKACRPAWLLLSLIPGPENHWALSLSVDWFAFSGIVSEQYYIFFSLFVLFFFSLGTTSYIRCILIVHSFSLLTA